MSKQYFEIINLSTGKPPEEDEMDDYRKELEEILGGKAKVVGRQIAWVED